MKTTLRNLIEEDIDKVIDNEEIKKKNFFFLILHYLLENDRLNLVEIDELGIELSEEYESFLKDFDLELLESNGEIIHVLKSALSKFNARIAPILDKIKKLKKNDYSKNDIN